MAENDRPTGLFREVISLENSSVPLPTTRYTTLNIRESSYISQMLIGRGSSLLPSLLYIDMNCPGTACMAILLSLGTLIHILYISFEIIT